MTPAARILAEEILPAVAKVAKEAITGGLVKRGQRYNGAGSLTLRRPNQRVLPLRKQYEPLDVQPHGQMPFAAFARRRRLPYARLRLPRPGPARTGLKARAHARRRPNNSG